MVFHAYLMTFHVRIMHDVVKMEEFNSIQTDENLKTPMNDILLGDDNIVQDQSIVNQELEEIVPDAESSHSNLLVNHQNASILSKDEILPLSSIHDVVDNQVHMSSLPNNVSKPEMPLLEDHPQEAILSSDVLLSEVSKSELLNNEESMVPKNKKIQKTAENPMEISERNHSADQNIISQHPVVVASPKKDEQSEIAAAESVKDILSTPNRSRRAHIETEEEISNVFDRQRDEKSNVECEEQQHIDEEEENKVIMTLLSSREGYMNLLNDNDHDLSEFEKSSLNQLINAIEIQIDRLTKQDGLTTPLDLSSAVFNNKNESNQISNLPTSRSRDMKRSPSASTKRDDPTSLTARHLDGLEEIFLFYCKQHRSKGIGIGGTFESMAKNATRMIVSEWTRFLKDFSLVSDLINNSEGDRIFRLAGCGGKFLDFPAFKAALLIVAEKAYTRPPFDLPHPQSSVEHQILLATLLNHINADQPNIFRKNLKGFGSAFASHTGPPPVVSLASMRPLPPGKYHFPGYTPSREQDPPVPLLPANVLRMPPSPPKNKDETPPFFPGGPVASVHLHDTNLQQYAPTGRLALVNGRSRPVPPPPNEILYDQYLQMRSEYKKPFRMPQYKHQQQNDDINHYHQQSPPQQPPGSAELRPSSNTHQQSLNSASYQQLQLAQQQQQLQHNFHQFSPVRQQQQQQFQNAYNNNPNIVSSPNTFNNSSVSRVSPHRQLQPLPNDAPLMPSPSRPLNHAANSTPQHAFTSSPSNQIPSPPSANQRNSVSSPPRATGALPPLPSTTFQQTKLLQEEHRRAAQRVVAAEVYEQKVLEERMRAEARAAREAAALLYAGGDTDNFESQEQRLQQYTSVQQQHTYHMGKNANIGQGTQNISGMHDHNMVMMYNNDSGHLGNESVNGGNSSEILMRLLDEKTPQTVHSNVGMVNTINNISRDQPQSDTTTMNYYEYSSAQTNHMMEQKAQDYSNHLLDAQARNHTGVVYSPHSAPNNQQFGNGYY